MSETIRIVYYGMEGEGSTVKEAKGDASRKPEQLVAQVDEAGGMPPLVKLHRAAA